MSDSMGEDHSSESIKDKNLLGNDDSDPSQQADAAFKSLPDHVVVFVHGMGEALKGGTLLEWSEPLITSLHDIALDNIEAAGGDEFLDDSGPRPPALTIEAAHATREVPEIHISVYKPGFASANTPGQGFSSDTNDPSRLKIMLTEAHWAKDFTPSKVETTWLWGVKVSFVVWWRMLTLLRWNLNPRLSRVRAFLKFAWFMLILVPVGIISLPVLLLLLIILGVLIGLAKVPGIKPIAGKIVVLFGNFLGDPATWNKRPTQAAAMRQKVIDIVESVPDAKVTIVAHSQGAAVSGQVILNGRISPTNFVTVGSGLPLLRYAKYGANHCGDPVKEWNENAPKLRWINLWGKFDFVPAGPMAVKSAQTDPDPKWIRRQLQRFLAAARFVWNQIKRVTTLGKYQPREQSDREKRFRMLYDMADPSDIAGSNGFPYGPEEHPIFNRSAIIRDHIVYSQNRVEVIDPLAQLIYDNEDAPDLDPVGGSDLPLWFNQPTASEDVKTSDKLNAIRLERHRRMVNWLGSARALAVCAGLFLALPLTLVIQRLLGPLPEGFCGLKVARWTCIEPYFLWKTFNIWTDWVLLIDGALILALLLWILNGTLWTALHKRVERRRDKYGRRFCGGRWSLTLYLSTVGLLTVVIPAVVIKIWTLGEGTVSGLPNIIYGIYAVLLAILIIASFLGGNAVGPLHARLKDPQEAGPASSK